MSIEVLNTDAVKLQEQLKQREYHLAELVDEIVFAERERAKAVEEVECVRELATHLERSFQKFLQFHITMSHDILYPLLAQWPNPTSCMAPNAADISRQKQEVTQALKELQSESQISKETKKLMGAVLQSTSTVAPSLNRGAATDLAVDESARRVVVLSDSLLENQMTLSNLLRDLRNQAEGLLHRWACKQGEMDFPRVEGQQSRAGGRATSPFTVSHPQQSRSSATTASFRLENISQRNGRTLEMQEDLAKVEKERDMLQAQLQEQGLQRDVVKALQDEKTQLQDQLLYMQRRSLQEQALCRKLKERISQLEEQPVIKSPEGAPCFQCESVKAEQELMKHRMQNEIEALKTDKKTLESVNAAMTASALKPCSSPSGQEHKIGKLEGTIASLEAELKIMEMRLSMLQSDRDGERDRILALHEQEKERLRRERNEFREIVSKMSKEVEGLAAVDASNLSKNT